MIGNWGHTPLLLPLLTRERPDRKSSRYCCNDGYHTSHHLNPRRHWRHHPVSFLQQKETYATEKALVFHNIDYLMITIKLLQKDYLHLGKCLVPLGEQIPLSLEDRATMLRRHTRRFSEAEICQKFKVLASKSS